MTELGSKVYTTPSDIRAAEREFKRLRREGHAVSFSESFASGGKLLEAESTHYKTCVLCIERRKQNGNKSSTN